MIFRFLMILATLLGAAQVQAQSLNLNIAPNGHVSGNFGFGQQQYRGPQRYYAPSPGWQGGQPQQQYCQPQGYYTPPRTTTIRCQTITRSDGVVVYHNCWYEYQ